MSTEKPFLAITPINRPSTVLQIMKLHTNSQMLPFGSMEIVQMYMQALQTTSLHSDEHPGKFSSAVTV
jgi:hypothetical protein